MEFRVLPNYKEFAFLLKTQKKHFSASNCWEYTNSRFKENVCAFSKNCTTQENIKTSRLKKRPWNFYKKRKFQTKT